MGQGMWLGQDGSADLSGHCNVGNSGSHALVSAQKLLLGHEVSSVFSFLDAGSSSMGGGGGQAAWGQEQGQVPQAGGHKSCRAGASSHMNGRKAPRTLGADGEETTPRFHLLPVRGVKDLLAESGSQ